MGAGARRNTREHGSEVKAYAAGDLSAAAPEARSAAGQIGSPGRGHSLSDTPICFAEDRPVFSRSAGKARPSAASRSVSLAWKVGSPLRPEQESFFEALYKENFPLLWRKAAAVLHNSDLAAEVVQDLFHDTVKKIDEVMEQPEPQLWLRRQLIYKLLHA